MIWVGLTLVLAAILAYLAMLFVFHRFTYRTWIFDSLVVVGVVVSLVGWVLGGSGMITLTSVGAGVLWFAVTRHEFRLSGSPKLNVSVGDPIPPFQVVTTTDDPFSERDLIDSAPALLEMYRGWWCPTSNSQLDEIISQREALNRAGVTVYAASVDSPEEAAPLQERVGDAITVLCSVQGTMLDAVGVRDQRGAPWYDRLILGAQKRPIAMPAALVIDEEGIIVFAFRSERVDERARPEQVLAALP